MSARTPAPSEKYPPTLACTSTRTPGLWLSPSAASAVDGMASAITRPMAPNRSDMEVAGEVQEQQHDDEDAERTDAPGGPVLGVAPTAAAERENDENDDQYEHHDGVLVTGHERRSGDRDSVVRPVRYSCS